MNENEKEMLGFGLEHLVRNISKVCMKFRFVEKKKEGLEGRGYLILSLVQSVLRSIL